MSMIYSNRNTLEQLPDELLLLICRYLSSADVLFSFYDLNSRLSQTISGYYQHVVLAQLPFKRFNYICKSILPNIGMNVCSLVVSNQWKGILSNIFLSYFGENMSLIFPHLKQLTLFGFRVKSLKLFVDGLQNLTELFKITILNLFTELEDPDELENLLYQVFTSNNNRLNSIVFETYGVAFATDMKTSETVFSNIENLRLDLKTVADLHKVLTILPKVRYLYTMIHERSSEYNENNQYPTAPNIKCFHLQSFGLAWNIVKLKSIIQRIPNVEELSIAINTKTDASLTDGKYFLSLFSFLPLIKFSYFLRLHNPLSAREPTEILSTWKDFQQEIVCVKSDDNKTLALYTLPFTFSYLILSNSLAKNESFIERNSHCVKKLILYDVPAPIMDTFSAIKKCNKIHSLTLRINENIVVSEISKQIQFYKLPYLTKISTTYTSTINTNHFQRLIEMSPNLYHLEVTYDFLRSLFDDASLCLLLKQRITHLYVLVTLFTSLDPVTSSISDLASIFPSLKHLYLGLAKDCQLNETLILAGLSSLPYWKSLISFGAVDIVIAKDILLKGIQQWVVENSALHDDSSFIVDYTEQTFRLWL